MQFFFHSQFSTFIQEEYFQLLSAIPQANYTFTVSLIIVIPAFIFHFLNSKVTHSTHSKI